MVPETGSQWQDDGEPAGFQGPVLPENIRLVGSTIPSNALTEWGTAHRLRLFGWANGGYTWSSSGVGQLKDRTAYESIWRCLAA